MPEPRDPAFEPRVRASFARQGMMGLLRAELLAVEPGRVVIAAPVRPETSQQHGFAHAGLAWTIGDSAAGYSALTLTGPEDEVLTSEMKIHLLAPALGARLVAEGRILRAGRRLIVAAADVWAETEAGPRRHIATLLGTMIPVTRDG